MLLLEPCLADVPLILSGPTNYGPDRQPRIFRGRVEARSFSVKIHVCDSQLIGDYPCLYVPSRSRFHREKRCGSPVIIPILYHELLFAP